MRIPWFKEKFNCRARAENLLTYDINTVDVDYLIASLNLWVSISCAVFHDITNTDLRALLSSTNDSKTETQSLSLKRHFDVIKLVLKKRIFIKWFDNEVRVQLTIPFMFP